MRLRAVLVAVVSAALALTPLSARAGDHLEPAIGIALDEVRAQHGINEPGTPQWVTVYFLEPEVRYGRVVLRAEWLPWTPQVVGLNTDLKVFIPEVRVAATRWLDVGVGETIYNQTSRFTDVTERSRVAGVRLVAAARLDRRGSFVTISGTPRMTGHVHDECIGTVVSNTFSCVVSLRRRSGEASESGSQMDALARWYVWQPRHVDVFVGVRYVNFIADIRYRDHFDTDHNQGA